MANIIIRNYDHYNTAMGKHIKNRRQYYTEMDKGGYVSQEEGERIAQKARENSAKNYELSSKARELINCAKDVADKKGNIKLGDNLINGMKEVGVKFDAPVPGPDAQGFYEIGR